MTLEQLQGTIRKEAGILLYFSRENCVVNQNLKGETHVI